MCFWNRLQWILPLAVMVVASTSSMMLFQEDPSIGNPPPAPMWSIVSPYSLKEYLYTSNVLTSGTKIDDQSGKIELMYDTTSANEELIAAPGTIWAKQFNAPSAGWPMPNRQYNHQQGQWEKLYYLELFSNDGVGGWTPEHLIAITITEPGDPPQ